MEVANAAEWQQARTVFVHTSGVEGFLGIAHPAAALFERPFALAGKGILKKNLIL
jgi:arginine deiminase